MGALNGPELYPDKTSFGTLTIQSTAFMDATPRFVAQVLNELSKMFGIPADVDSQPSEETKTVPFDGVLATSLVFGRLDGL